jgi:hypothetical protein
MAAMASVDERACSRLPATDEALVTGVTGVPGDVRVSAFFREEWDA